MPERIKHQDLNGVECAWCTCHKQFHPLGEFHRDRSRWDGLQSMCKRYVREYQQTHQTKIASYLQEYYRAHQEKALAYTSEWQGAHPERTRATSRRYSRKRRATLRKLLHEPYRDEDVCERDKGVCQICGEPIGEEAWHIDHFIPISKGGPDIPQNIRLAHARCNDKKGNRMPTHEEAQAWLATIRSWEGDKV